MVNYEKIFEPYYEGGWEAYPLETTLITAGALNDYDAAIMHIEDYLANQNDPNDNLAETYDDTATYEVGDYCVYNGVLYKCITAIDEAEDFDLEKWDHVLVTDEMGSGGGGGTTVIANPVGTPTDDLETIQIGETIYDIPGGGGGNANIWTGTQAELEEVFDELEEGTQINITDDEQEVVEGGTIYSEDEQVIGLWTNNKPLYSKVFDLGSDISVSNTTLTSTGIDATNMESIVEAKGYYSTMITYNSLMANISNNEVLVQTTRQNTSSSIRYIYLEYTKSTDAPLDAVIGKSTMYIASSDCYSTVEKEIGVFADGKPLYQKTIYSSGGNLSSGQIVIPNDFANIDHVASWKCVTHDTARDRDYCLDHNRLDATEDVRLQVYVASDDTVGLVILVTKTTFLTAIGDTWITLQYTKTTDTAGSGSYTPASGKAVHYSTDEQVIGTWIDGSTLYRKTFDIGNLLNNGTKTVAHGISNLKYVINWSGTCYSTIDTGYCRPIPLSDPTAANTIRLDVGGGNINIKTGSDWSAYKAFVTLEYTKTV